MRLAPVREPTQRGRISQQWAFAPGAPMRSSARSAHSLRNLARTIKDGPGDERLAVAGGRRHLIQPGRPLRAGQAVTVIRGLEKRAVGSG